MEIKKNKNGKYFLGVEFNDKRYSLYPRFFIAHAMFLVVGLLVIIALQPVSNTDTPKEYLELVDQPVQEMVLVTKPEPKVLEESYEVEAEAPFDIESFSYAYDSEYEKANMNKNDVSLVVETALRYGVDPHLALSVIEQESDYNKYAKNPTSSATGAFQVVEQTGRWILIDVLKIRTSDTYNHEVDMMNLELNAEVACWYLSYLDGAYDGDMESAILISYSGETTGMRYINEMRTKMSSNDIVVVGFND